MATGSWSSPLNPPKISPLADKYADSSDYKWAPLGTDGYEAQRPSPLAGFGQKQGGALSMKSPLVIGLIVLLLVVVVYYVYKKNPSMFSMKKSAPAPASSG